LSHICLLFYFSSTRNCFTTSPAWLCMSDRASAVWMSQGGEGGCEGVIRQKRSGEDELLCWREDLQWLHNPNNPVYFALHLSTLEGRLQRNTEDFHLANVLLFVPRKYEKPKS
jgi:hypothetical protein